MDVTVIRDAVTYAFAAEMTANFSIKAGSEIEVQAPDGLHGQVRTETDVYAAVDPDHVNDAVGPIFIEDAEPGDTLKVSIHSIDVPQETGYVILIPDFGVLQDRVSSPVTKIVKTTDRQIQFNELFLEMSPCIGTIGVAPASGRFSTLLPGDHGGNLDTTEIRAGNILYLPVFQPGAMLAMGDPKAVMGDGECSGTGVGVPINIRARIDVIKESMFTRPAVETTSEIQFIASAETFELAARRALEDCVASLQRLRAWSWEDAYMFASLAGDVRVSQLVNPLVTARFAIPKRALWELSVGGVGTK